VILSDTKTQQHWLADGASTILHLCRAWLSGKHTRLTPKCDISSVWSPPLPAGPETSFDTLKSDENRQIQLYPSSFKREIKAELSDEQSDAPVTGSSSSSSQITKEWYLLVHQAQCFYHWLEQIHDRILGAQYSGTIDLSRRGTKTVGFEFRDMLSSSKHIEAYTFDCGDGANAWLPYTRSVNAIHIYGTNFGNLLTPTKAQDQKLHQCDLEDAAPVGMGSLMAPLSVLKESIERFKHTDGCAQLARGVYWTDVANSFAICRCRRHKTDKSCRTFVRKLHTESSLSSQSHAAVVALPEVSWKRPTAAVIFGSEPTSLVSKVRSLVVPHVRRRKDADPSSIKRSRGADSGYDSNHRIGSSHEGGGSSGMTVSPPTPPSDKGLAADGSHEHDNVGSRKRQRLDSDGRSWASGPSPSHE
jgi:hypothetical protein